MLYLHGLGHFHPDNEITNAFLESLDIGTSDEWILSRVGIRSRRTVLPLDYIRRTKNRSPVEANEAAIYDNAATGAEAAKMALKRAGLGPSDIGMVISGGCYPDSATPAEACNIAARLGIECFSFDVSSACTTFALQMHVLDAMRPEKLPDFVLLVQPENMTRCVNYAMREAAVLWGDASTAAVVSTRVPSRVTIEDVQATSTPSGAGKVLVRKHGHFEQDGSAVQSFAIKRSTQYLRGILEGTDGPSDLYFVGHQANLRMLESVRERCGVPSDRHLYNIDRFGNTGAAGAPSVLSEHWETLRPGARYGMVLVGAGLTWARLIVRVGTDT